jgi:chorismate synthase
MSINVWEVTSMSSEFGKLLKVSVFGQSHGKAIGVNIDGLPAGEAIDLEALNAFLDRRKTGKNALSTQRKEADTPIFLSGLENGVTCGFPMCVIIENSDQHSSDYRNLADHPRPSHADYTAQVKWGGHADMRGGGHFSGRLTAPLCIAGGIAKQILARRGIHVGAHLSSVGVENDTAFPLYPTKELFDSVAGKAFPVLDDEAGARMQEIILDARQNLDSVGGIIECAAIGLPIGLGDPMFDGIENRLAAALFGIPAVKGVEFGLGFESARIHGSENNDPFTVVDGKISTETNRCGGILGGITTGMPLVLQVAVKPTPSIAKPQTTISYTQQTTVPLEIKGRHDPCIVPRAVPVVEAAVAVALYDAILGKG